MLLRLTRPHPWLWFGIGPRSPPFPSGPPAQSSAVLTRIALTMAGLGSWFPFWARHHWMRRAQAPATCGAAMDVPVRKVYWWINLPGLFGSGTPVPEIGPMNGSFSKFERAAATSVPGATTVGRSRPSRAGPRLDEVATPRMSSVAPIAGRNVRELPTTIVFLFSLGPVIVLALEPEFPAENTITK